MGVFQNKPMVFTDENGEAQGLFIDVLRAVAEREDWDLEFVPGTWSEGLERLRKGEIDFVCYIVYTHGRDAYADYTREVVWTVWGMVFVRSHSRIESVPTMEGKKVAVMKGSVHVEDFRRLCQEFGITCEVLCLPTGDDVLRAVQDGTVDAGVINSVFGSMNAHRFRIQPSPIVFSPSNTFYAVPEGKNADLAAAVDGYLREWKSDKDSPYYRSVNRWFKHGSRERTVPKWLVFALCGLALGAVLLFVWVRTLRRVVEARTAALRESEERFALAMEASRDGLWDWNVETGYTYFSPGYAAMLGYAMEEVTSHVDWAIGLLHPEDREAVLQIAGECVEGGRSDFAIEFRIRAKNGEWHWVLGRGSAAEHDESGKAIRMIGTHTDVTARKQAEAAREKLEGQLRQSQKMEAIGQLAGGIAHDFNNLLQAILGYGDLALDDLRGNANARSAVREMLKASQRAKTLVSQLLAFSRRQVLDMCDVDLNALIGDLVEMIRRLIGEHIRLDVLAGHSLGVIHADPGQIEQILVNLCVNARDAMPDGGTITIETENVRIDEEYCRTHAWAKPGRYVMLSVTDTGCGMDAETLANVFEPFFTTKDVGQGTGLGLSTVYGLISQHGGFVHAYSELGEGSTFKIYFPSVERAAANVGHKIEGAVSGGNETILLAEDEPVVRELTREVLERAGYRVLAAQDGREALRVFDQNADEIDLAMLDVIMPELGGKAVYEVVRERKPDLPVLFTSGYSMNAVHTNFVLDEGLELIQKPASRQSLLRRVRAALDGV